jgi:hypothetical protein
VDLVFVDGDEVTGVLERSEASPRHALVDLASLSLGTVTASASASPAMAPPSTAT